MRRSELAALTVADVAFEPGGMLQTIRRSKGDPDGEGQVVAVATGDHATTVPVAAMRAWLAVGGTRLGKVFTRVRPSDHLSVY